MNITRFENWMLRRIFRRVVIQGPHHQSNIAEVYRLAHTACKREFYEDNDPTLHAFLNEQFQAILNEQFQSSWSSAQRRGL